MIDDRANGRTMLGLTYARTVATPGPYPGSVFIGPKAVLIDENAGSDGDIFPWMFRTAKLGQVIGQRTWDGVVGITSQRASDYPVKLK
ncbi:MAG TPA: S41 family peptidase [Bryobacteraceae bacterium]|nr:S41 family peptidase [Bryobacteraceae bacterium]